VDKGKAGAYYITYTVENSAGVEAAATCEVRILAATEKRSPRTTYNFTGQGVADSATTHNGIFADDAGFMDFYVTEIDNGMIINVEVINQATDSAVYSDIFTCAGGTQFRVDKGWYEVIVNIIDADEYGKYGIRLVTPEKIDMVFEEAEVPLSSPDMIRRHIVDGYTPLELCMQYGYAADELNIYYLDFRDAGWLDEDLAWLSEKKAGRHKAYNTINPAFFCSILLNNNMVI